MKKQISLIVLLVVFTGRFNGFTQNQLGKILTAKDDAKGVLFHCEEGQFVKLSIVTNDMFRVQVGLEKDFKTAAMVKLGFVKNDFPAVNFKVIENDSYYELSTSSLLIQISKSAFRITVKDKKGNIILRDNKNLGMQTGKKNTLNFDMPADEHFFGFGFMRKTLDARGHKLTFKREYRWKEATVPFFMSTRGYAFYSNSVYNHDFDFTNKSNQTAIDYYSITTGGGLVDYYFIYGPDFPRLLDRYTDLTGKTMLVPRWAFGLEYRLRYYGNDQELLDVARTFREKEIPCDIMALEPGWESVAYSMDWKWSKERFPNPEKMTKELDSMGFKLDLWESGVAPTKNISDPIVRKNWFAKRKVIVKSGVKMFKQDDPYPRSILSQELLGPVLANNKLRDGLMNAEELNNVANSLYSETLFNEYRKLTNERAVVMFHAYNASVASHRWPFQWAGDFQAANGMINASLSGHAMVSYDIRNPYAAGWHQGFFTPFSVVDSWAYYREPWLYSESIEQSHRLYACLRSRLVPYLYSSLWQSHISALPIERPMVLNYNDDPNTYQMSSQFMVGDWFLLALSDSDDSPAGEKVDFWTGSQKGNYGRAYLPAGKWIDYWSGEEQYIDKAQWVKGEWPEYLGGLLYVKAGAIIPMGQVKNFIGETKDEIVVLDIYPHKSSSYQLYEDDGTSYKYENGEYTVTTITSLEKKNSVEIDISGRKGSYKGMPQKRGYVVKAHSFIIPKYVIVDGNKLNYFKNANELIYSPEHKGWYYDKKAKKVVIKMDKGWNYSSQARNIDPLATIPPTAKYERINWIAGEKPKEGKRKIVLQFPTLSRPSFYSNIPALPADNFSQANIELRFPLGETAIGDVQVSLNGPIKLLNGDATMTITAENNLIKFSVLAGSTPGLGIIEVKGKGIEDARFELPVYGKPVNLNITTKEVVLVADGENKIALKGELFDQLGFKVLNVASPLIVKVEGEATCENRLKQDSIRFTNGKAQFYIQSTKNQGKIRINSSFTNLTGNEIIQESAKGVMQVRTNPPEKVKLDSDGGWIPDHVTVFVNFRANGHLVHNNFKQVTLNVYSKDNKLLDTYVQKAKKGEVIFKDISYYKRPAQCLFEIKCDGYETVTRKVFENTWELDPKNIKKQDGH